MAENMHVSPDYLTNRDNADALINLREFLNHQGWNDNRENTLCMLSATLKRPVPDDDYGVELLDEIEYTLDHFTLPYLMSTNLYHLNRGVLLVACVEYYMYYGEERDLYDAIYRCDNLGAVEQYNMLRGYPIDYLPDARIALRAIDFFRWEKLVTDRCFADRIRYYLSKVEMDPEEMLYIKNKSISVIEDREGHIPWFMEDDI